MKELFTEVTINASAKHVFEILVDIAKYEKWNPFIVSASGNVAVGEKLDILIRPPPGQSNQRYVVKVLSIDPDREFIWLGHMKMRGILDGRHFFELFTLGPNRVRVIHREQFSGLLVPFVWHAFLNTHMRAGFEAMNRELKALAEQ